MPAFTYPIGLLKPQSGLPAGMIASNFSTVLTNFTWNGSTKANDRNANPNLAYGVDLANDPNLNSSNLGITGSGDRTFCLWIYRSTGAQEKQVIHGGVTFEFRTIQLRITYAANTINVLYNANLDNWYFYVIKLNGTQLGDFEIKENNSLKTTPANTTVINSSDTPISIANYPDDTPANDAYDNIYIFDRLTTDEEDTTLFNF